MPHGDTPHVNQYRWIILLGLITAAIMQVLDTTIVNVALPQMAGNLGATPDEIGWVATGYILSNVVVLPLTAFLSSWFGRKRYLTGSILLFVIASFFCGTSRSLAELVFWRILQGAGGAALLSTAQATLVEIFPRNQQGLVQSLFGLGLVVAPTVAPALGGWLTDNYSWPWVFFVNIPIGAVSMLLTMAFLHDSPHKHHSNRVDWAGIGLLAVGLSSLQYVLEEGNRDDWFESALIVRFAVLAGITLLVFLAWELWPGNTSPVVNLRVLRDRGLTAGVIIGTALGFGLYGGVFIFPLFVQNVLGFSATETGLVLLPGGVATAIGVIFCGQVLQRGFDARYLIGAGLLITTFAMWQLGHLTPQSGIPDTRLALIIRGAGLGLLFIPINVAAFATLRGPDIAQGSGLLNLSRQLGGSFGIAVLSTYVANMTVFHRVALASDLYAGNPLLDQRLAALRHAFIGHGYGVVDSQSAALKALGHAVQLQAQTQSYNDAFLLIGIACLISLPAVFLLKRGRRGGAPAPAMAD